jgi:HEAT repeat protein
MKLFNTALQTLVLSAVCIAAAPLASAAPTEPYKEGELIRVLQSDAPLAEKAITCKRLAVWGTPAAVPALAPLLESRDLNSWARIALEAIPGSAADKALRDALDKTQGRLLVGVINSIGVRRDAKAVKPLVAKLNGGDADVAAAAAAALGRIGGSDASKALLAALKKAPASQRGAIALGCVLAGENYLAQKNNSSAQKAAARSNTRRDFGPWVGRHSAAPGTAPLRGQRPAGNRTPHRAGIARA